RGREAARRSANACGAGAAASRAGRVRAGAGPRERASRRSRKPSARASPRAAPILLPALREPVPHPQGEHPEQRRPPPELVPVLAIERARELERLGRTAVQLLAAGFAAALTAPAHRRSLRAEAVAVPEHGATQHLASVTGRPGTSLTGT